MDSTGKKYILTDITKTLTNGNVVRRIQAIKDFADVHEGDLGGWVESEKNLSQYGDCWVYDDAIVQDHAQVINNAKIHHNAAVCDGAIVRDRAIVSEFAVISDAADIKDTAKVYDYAHVYNEAMVLDSACVKQMAEVKGYALVKGSAIISEGAIIQDYAIVGGNVNIYRHAIIGGNMNVFGLAIICGDTCLCKNWDIRSLVRFSHTPKRYITVGPIGSRQDITTFYIRDEDDQIWVETGCFVGTIDEFRKAISEVHKLKNPGVYDEYNIAIDSAVRLLI